MVSLSRAIAIAMVDRPSAGLSLLEPLSEPLAGHHRLHAVRAHLLEMAGEVDAALAEYDTAASRTTSVPENHYLTMRAARLNERRKTRGGRRQRSRRVEPAVVPSPAERACRERGCRRPLWTRRKSALTPKGRFCSLGILRSPAS